MATFQHPVTGVTLNVIDVHRQNLNPAEALTARLLVHEGDEQHIAAAKLGVNPGRVNEIIKEDPSDPRQSGLDLE